MITPSAFQPIVDKDGKPTPEFAAWMQLVSRLDIKSGTVTPEGNVDATQKTLYMLETGTSENIVYIKKTTASDKTGWVLL